jgi:hypothetical protein
MATTKGAIVTLMDAEPRQRLERGTINAKSRIFRDTAAVADGDFDADGDVVYLAEVPSNAKIVSIKIANDDLDAGTDSLVNVGLYNGQQSFTDSTATSYAAGAVIDEDCYATVVTGFQAATGFTEYAFEARDINAVSNYVWEDAGLPEDPGTPLRIAITQTAAVTTDAAGDVSIIVEYSEE